MARDWFSDDEAFPELSNDGALQMAFGVVNQISSQTENLELLTDSIGKLEAFYRYRNLPENQNDEW